MSADRDAALAELNVVFRPRRARLVTTGLAIAIFVLLLVIALVLPSGNRGDFRWYDRLAMVGVGAAIAAFLMRFATSHATPTPDVLRVRNLAGEVVLPWSQIKGVRFNSGDPWVMLLLVDSDEQAVMAVQRADGPRGAAEARRLATLLAYHQRSPSSS